MPKRRPQRSTERDSAAGNLCIRRPTHGVKSGQHVRNWSLDSESAWQGFDYEALEETAELENTGNDDDMDAKFGY